MYIGRFVVVAPSWGGYRVSSRSFPHRRIVERDETLTVVPTEAAEPTDNPYISYNCMRRLDDTAVIGNGTHVDHIAEKLELGYPPRDALALGLFALDFERDAYDTPRLAGVIGEQSYIGIVRRDALHVQVVDEPTLVATYELDEPTPIDLEGGDAASIARALFDLEYEHPICAAGLVWEDGGSKMAIENGSQD